MDEKTINTYNKMAVEYDNETIDFWKRFPKSTLDNFSELTKKKVLDIGNGPGRDGLLLRKYGLEVVCLDASEKMVQLSSQRGLKSVLGDFNNLPFSDKSFDGIWSYTSLLHVPKKQLYKSINEIKRVLKRNGILGLGMIEGEGEKYKKSAGVNLPRWFSFYTKQEIEKLLQRYGFEVLYFEKFKPKTKNYLNFIAKKI